MRQHRIRYERSSGPPVTHWAACSCRKWASEHRPTRKEAEDDAWRHLRDVRSAQSALRRQPSLPATLAYYREQQNNPEQPPRDRALFKQMGDELEHRLGIGHEADDEPLPFE